GLSITEEEGLLRVVASGAAETAGTAQDTAAQAEARLYVYRLKHAQATRLAGTLQQIFGGGRGGPAPRSASPRPPLSQRLREQQIQPVEPDAPTPEVRVELGPAEPSLPAQLRGDVQIVPEETTNSLLVRAQPADWEVVQQAIQSL